MLHGEASKLYQNFETKSLQAGHLSDSDLDGPMDGGDLAGAPSNPSLKLHSWQASHNVSTNQVSYGNDVDLQAGMTDPLLAAYRTVSQDWHRSVARLSITLVAAGSHPALGENATLCNVYSPSSSNSKGAMVVGASSFNVVLSASMSSRPSPSTGTTLASSRQPRVPSTRDGLGREVTNATAEAVQPARMQSPGLSSDREESLEIDYGSEPAVFEDEESIIYDVAATLACSKVMEEAQGFALYEERITAWGRACILCSFEQRRLVEGPHEKGELDRHRQGVQFKGFVECYNGVDLPATRSNEGMHAALGGMACKLGCLFLGFRMWSSDDHVARRAEPGARHNSCSQLALLPLVGTTQQALRALGVQHGSLTLSLVGSAGGTVQEECGACAYIACSEGQAPTHVVPWVARRMYGANVWSKRVRPLSLRHSVGILFKGFLSNVLSLRPVFYSGSLILIASNGVCHELRPKDHLVNCM